MIFLLIFSFCFQTFIGSHIFYAVVDVVVFVANAGESTDEPRTSRVTSLINGAVGWLADWLADYVTLSALCLVWLDHTAVLRGFP